jgi:hypothetical protein
MNYETFHNSLFELADLWTDEISGREYAGFLRQALKMIADLEGDKMVWKSDGKIAAEKGERAMREEEHPGNRKWSQENLPIMRDLRKMILEPLPKDLRRQLEVLLDDLDVDEQEHAVLASLMGFSPMEIRKFIKSWGDWTEQERALYLTACTGLVEHERVSLFGRITGLSTSKRTLFFGALAKLNKQDMTAFIGSVLSFKDEALGQFLEKFNSLSNAERTKMIGTMADMSADDKNSTVSHFNDPKNAAAGAGAFGLGVGGGLTGTVAAAHKSSVEKHGESGGRMPSAATIVSPGGTTRTLSISDTHDQRESRAGGALRDIGKDLGTRIHRENTLRGEKMSRGEHGVSKGEHGVIIDRGTTEYDPLRSSTTIDYYQLLSLTTGCSV